MVPHQHQPVPLEAGPHPEPRLVRQPRAAVGGLHAAARLAGEPPVVEGALDAVTSHPAAAGIGNVVIHRYHDKTIKTGRESREFSLPESLTAPRPRCWRPGAGSTRPSRTLRRTRSRGTRRGSAPGPPPAAPRPAPPPGSPVAQTWFQRIKGKYYTQKIF